jgi:hypothetical protein
MDACCIEGRNDCVLLLTVLAAAVIVGDPVDILNYLNNHFEKEKIDKTICYLSSDVCS